MRKELTAFTLFVAANTLSAQNGLFIQQPLIPEPNPQLSLANVAYEPLGPGDLVYVAVADCPEVTHSYRVSAEGEITLSLLRHPVHAAGVLPADLQTRIGKALEADHILLTPLVSVSILEYRSRPVSVTGAVKHSVTFQAIGDIKLLDAIARADGFAADAGPELLVSRISSAGGNAEEIKRISIRTLLSGSDPAFNMALHGGETITVPEASKLYIAGNVKAPGAYALNETGASTVIRALAMCQGTLPFTDKTAYIYRTTPGTKQRQEIPIPLKDILHRRSPDVALQANDILYVQDNSRKRVTAATLDRIAGFGSTAASSLIIWK